MAPEEILKNKDSVWLEWTEVVRGCDESFSETNGIQTRRMLASHCINYARSMIRENGGGMPSEADLLNDFIIAEWAKPVDNQAI